jgi:transposase
MLYKDYTQELIRFKGVTITFVKREGNYLHIHMSMDRKPHKCPRCSKTTKKIHDYRTQREE